MIPIGIVLLVLALILYPIAFRGRVVSRGQYCRKCRFDLVGSSMNDGDRCSECGSPIHLESARRTTLRRPFRSGMVVSVLMLLIGTGAIGFGIWGNPAAAYSGLPDSVVVQGVKWGSSAALDEASTRLATSPPFAQEYRDDLINYALDVQADRSRPWDPRLGQLLLDALVNGQLNQEQVESYAINGWTHTLDLRDKVHAGEKFIQYMLASEGDRVVSKNFTMTKFKYGVRLVEYGIQGGDALWKIHPNRSMGGRMYIVSSGGGSTTMSSLWNMDTYTSQAAVGSSIPIYIDIEIRMEEPGLDEPIVSNVTRLKQSVLVVDPSEPIVQITNNTEQAEKITEAITIGPLHTMLNPTPPGPNHYNIIMKLSAMIDAIPAPFSFNVFLHIGDQEVYIGELVRHGPDEEPRGQYMQWGISPDDSAGLEQALALHAIALEQGAIDVVFKTEPKAALKIPTIDQVVETTIVFKDVPIKIVETPTDLNNPDWDEKQIVGELILD